jgi:hypothetical protein
MSGIRYIDRIAHDGAIANFDLDHGGEHAVGANVHFIPDDDAAIQFSATMPTICFQSAVSHDARVFTDFDLLRINDPSR